MGREFRIDLLARVVAADAREAEQLLATAAGHQLLSALRDGTYRFTHDLIRETLVLELSPLQGQHLHLVIAEAIEASGDREPTLQGPADLAYLRGSRRSGGAAYAIRAGEHALHASAAREAMRHFRNAIGLLDPTGDVNSRARALIGLGDAATHISQLC